MIFCNYALYNKIPLQTTIEHYIFLENGRIFMCSITVLPISILHLMLFLIIYLKTDKYTSNQTNIERCRYTPTCKKRVSDARIDRGAVGALLVTSKFVLVKEVRTKDDR